MKKISYLLTAALLLLGFTSCEDDKDPVYTVPESFTLNTPAMADQLYKLVEGNYTELTCSQPEYGFVASVTYGIEVSFDKSATYAIAPKTATSATIRLADADIATAMCVLRGIETPEDWDEPGPMPLFVRATAQLGPHDNTLVKSNWVELKKVEGYFSVPQPGFIYLIGAPSGWTGPDEGNAAALGAWTLSEKKNAIGSKIYYGCFDVAAGQFQLRFYTELTGWDGGASLGYQEADQSTAWNWADENVDGVVIKNCAAGKGNYEFPDWPGGEVTMIVNLIDHTVTFMEGNQL